jgi:Gas vesicle synthesis protein GvpL/GvpF
VTGTVAATALYAYAVVKCAPDGVLPAVGDDLELVGTGGLAAVVAEVPLSEFGEDVLPSRLNDRNWLEATARDHDDVLRRLLGVTTVIPLRFGSIHRDRAAVERFLDEHRDAFSETLERLRDRVELGVKVWARTERDAARAEPTPSTGREYLERRRREREGAATAAARLDERLRAVHERLLGVAAAGVLNRPQPRELTGAADEMVLNAAYLVAAGDDTLAREVERLRSEHPDLAFDVTGPWAPYNFVGGDDG